MTDEQEGFPREIFDRAGRYTVRRAASYLVDDPRIRELAEIGYARRDLTRAEAFIAACTTYGDGDRQRLHEESLWSAAVVFYARPFGRNNARTHFDADAFVRERLDPEGLKRHMFLRRCRDKWIAHDDGLGESKAVAIYLPPTPPRSWLDVGLHQIGRRVISLGTDIARELEPHIAQVRTMIADHEDRVRDGLAVELVKTRFDGVRLTGYASEEDLVKEFQSLFPSRS